MLEGHETKGNLLVRIRPLTDCQRAPNAPPSYPNFVAEREGGSYGFYGFNEVYDI